MQLNMIDKITRFGTGIMLGAFAIIIPTTTFFQPLIGGHPRKVILGDHMFCATLAFVCIRVAG